MEKYLKTLKTVPDYTRLYQTVTDCTNANNSHLETVKY